MRQSRFVPLISGSLGLGAILFILAMRPVVTPSPDGTPANFKIAFIGDQDLGTDAVAVLNLIKSEGASAVVHSGDFDYSDNPSAWENQINSVLGPNFPYFASVGNHDESRFYGTSGYQSFMIARMNRLGLSWDGDLGVKSSFKYQGIFFLLTGPDVLGTGHDIYIRDKLAADNSIWSISSWHKNMRLMQVGGKSDATGWGVYEESRKGGAIIATAHEHSYSRTHLLSRCQTQTVASTSNTLVLNQDDASTPADEGRSFVFVSGLGGNSVRNQELSGAWWASIYTSNQNATHGALFGVFNFEGIPNKAHFYFKAINGAVPDDFYVISNVIPPPPPAISFFAPTEGPYGTEVTVNGNNFTGASLVKFNGVAGSFAIVSEAEIRAIVPAGADTGPISVTTSGGTATSAENFNVTPPPPPSIDSFTPIRGPVGTQVTITGNNFIGASEVAFNGAAGSNLTVLSNTQVRASVPTGATTGAIRITTPGGSVTSVEIFTVTVPPSISSFNPTNGPAGTQVTIAGSNFTGVTQVSFNGVVAGGFIFDSDNQIHAAVPTSATTGKISVTTPDGTAFSSSDFTVTALPAVNLALNKPATASSTYGSNTPSRAFDGSTSTYWRSSSNSTAWLRVDLGSAQTVGRAVIKWNGSYYARTYQLQVSNNGSSWTNVYSTSSGGSGTKEIAFVQITARYVRLYMTRNNRSSYRVNELEVYSGAAALAKNEAEEALEDESIDLSAHPEKIVLYQNYPNPFNASTVITYSIPAWRPITIKAYNLAGQEVATLVDGFHDAGEYRVVFNAAGLPSGNYFVVLKTQPETFVQRLLFVK
jgi:hypothetical protein